MNILLWILQILLASHTDFGAIWKLFHSPEQTMPSLAAIPHSVWMLMVVIELICSVFLVLPAARKLWGKYISAAALVIAIEMLPL